MIIEIAAFAYFSAVSVYSLIFSVAGTLYKSSVGKPHANKYNKMAVLIPAYQEDHVIVPMAREALKQNYPSACFDVVVIADSLQQKTMDQLGRLPVKLVEVRFENSTKVKALRAGMAQLNNTYDIALILDADNLMKDDFLQKINSEFNSGARVIQAYRAAKNLNTSFAILDAYSEIINNHIFRKGSQALGLSPPLAGSGMAFPFALLKEMLEGMQAVGGFDKELQMKIVEKGYQIKYLDKAVVLDEKVSQPEVFGNQRRRWMSSQFLYIRRFFKIGMVALLKGKIDLFHITILNNIQLPRIINLGWLVIMLGFSTMFSGYTNIPSYYWLALLGANVAAMLIAVPLKFYNRHFLIALMSVPKAFIIMCCAMLKLKGANQKFIHTPHTT